MISLLPLAGLPFVLARPPWRMTWMKQCLCPLGGSLPWRRKGTGGVEGEMEKLAVQGFFSVAASGSKHPGGNADHWSTQTVLTKEESEGVKLAENERLVMEVDEVIPGIQPSSNETGWRFY